MYGVVFPPLLLMGTEIDKKCDRGDCMVLIVNNGDVQVQITGEYRAKRTVGRFDVAVRNYVPNREAPIKHMMTNNGWLVIVTVALPEAFDIAAPSLRLHMLNASTGRKLATDAYNTLNTLSAGELFGTRSNLVLISSTGEHSYVVQTRMWLVPTEGSPRLLLDVTGLVKSIQTTARGSTPGVWIERQNYDGIHSETKSKSSEFWVWSEDQQALVLRNNSIGQVARPPSLARIRDVSLREQAAK